MIVESLTKAEADYDISQQERVKKDKDMERTH